MIKNTSILVVDLDGTLLKSDMLYECFWSAFGRNLLSPFWSLLKLLSGKASFKSYLYSESDINVSSLPYDKKIIEYIREHHSNGGRTVLVTATNHTLAKNISEYLKIFDEVFGSSDDKNLKDLVKAKFLVDRYGENNFYYMGDSKADLSVWQVSSKIITVNAVSSLRKKTEKLDKPFEHLETKKSSLYLYLTALRPHQWLKNILIFAPMLAAHDLNFITLAKSVLAFISFSIISSSVYILNDLLDLNADRDHPRKCFRPLASGSVSIAYASFLIFGLLVVGLVIAALLGWIFLITIIIYYLLTTIYSISLKRIIVIDLCLLAGFYIMRIVSGGLATGIDLSVWLLTFSIFLFLSLAAIKRQAELVDILKHGKYSAKGRGYVVDDLPIITTIGFVSGYVAVLIMVLYVNSSEVQNLYSTPNALWGICCVLLFWLSRMLIITQQGKMFDDPVLFAYKDRVSQVCFIAMVIFGMMGALI